MNNTQEFVVLVTPEDHVIGRMEKQEAHIKGALHRAFSVFLFNNSGEMLLQQRAEGKYHSPNLWTNACCSHPRENETYINAAHRRLQEELGVVCKVEEKFHFIYKAEVGQGLTEHELDHVFVGKFIGDFKLNDEEVKAVKWLSVEAVIEDIDQQPEIYTEWFKIIFKEYLKHLL